MCNLEKACVVQTCKMHDMSRLLSFQLEIELARRVHWSQVSTPTATQTRDWMADSCNTLDMGFSSYLKQNNHVAGSFSAAALAVAVIMQPRRHASLSN